METGTATPQCAYPWSLEPVYVYMFEQQDPVTGTWSTSPRLATLPTIARLGGRPIRNSGRLVFAEVVAADGFVTRSYVP